jgi:prepilin-type N-terminal cleavage/methylation domain-containing protein
MNRRIDRMTDPGRQAGFSLMELLVGAAIAGTVLAAAFGWLWNVGALAARADDRIQVATIAATCSRAVALEVRAAVDVVPPPVGRDPARSFALVHDHPGAAQEDVLVVWDPARGVVWRNASGTYLADHVTQFSIAYGLLDGREVDGEDMGSSDWAIVRCLRVGLETSVGAAVVERSILVGVGSS